MEFSRRGFLRNASLAGGAVALLGAGSSALAASAKHDDMTASSGHDTNFDVIIVGGGFAGMMAAIELAAERPDARVALIERNAYLGGSLRLSDGFFIGFSERYNEDPADCATPDQMLSMISAAAQDVVDHDYAQMKTPLNEQLIRDVFAEMPDVIGDLLLMGVPFQKPLDTSSPFATGAYAPDVFAVGTDGLGATFADAVEAHLRETAVDIRLEAQVSGLIVEDGAVVGVAVEQQGKTSELRAPAVLLATGGFAASPEKIAEYLPAFKDCVFYPNPGATGSAIDFTRAFGTPLVSDGVFGGLNAADETFTITNCHFLVNERGERFFNEAQNWYISLWPVVQNTQAASGWCICDADYVQRNPEEAAVKLEAGTLVEYASLEELCHATGIDQAGLKKTIDAYNTALDHGEDPAYGLPASEANRVASAPFYAEKTTSWCFGTIKGLATDTSCRILDEKGTPVPGLWAAGEVMAGNALFGQYPGGGSGNSFAGNSGRHAARMIIDEAL